MEIEQHTFPVKRAYTKRTVEEGKAANVLTWNFKHERKFIDNLGLHSDVCRFKGETRITLLQQYRRSINKRKDWTMLEKRLMMEYTEKVLVQIIGD